jgi:hypothetical protein
MNELLWMAKSWACVKDIAEKGMHSDPLMTLVIHVTKGARTRYEPQEC